MSSYRRWSTVISSAIWLALTATIWIAFAPVQIGGRAAYVIVNGNSMEPNFHVGDLVIVRPRPSYDIGDRVVYQDPKLGSGVFHRIIDLELDRYILKGDNNAWIDSYQPTQEEIVGKLWAHLPRIGKAVQFLRQPVLMALIVGAFGGLLAMNIANKQSKGRRRMNENSLRELSAKLRHHSFRDWVSRLGENNLLNALREKISKRNINGADIPPEGNPRNSHKGSMTEGILFTLGLLVFGTLFLAIFSFARPATRLVPDDIIYQHFGFFSYSAAAPASVYDSGTLQSGQPIFPKTTCLVDVNFQYTLVGDQAEGIAGSHQLSALVTEPQSGWQRNILLFPTEPFSGNTFDTKANLDLCQIITLIEAMEDQTDFRPSLYTLSIIPKVSLSGSISGRELNDTFEPTLTFRYNRTHFQMISEEGEKDPLNPAEMRLLRGERREPNVLPIFGWEPKVPTLRIVSSLVFLLSLAGLILLGMQIQNLQRNDHSAFVRLKYDSLIVDIKSGIIKDSANTIDINSIDDLAKLAERHNVMILHDATGQEHIYYVQGDGNTYRFADGESGSKEKAQ
jgi:signal peptidase I